MSEIQTPSLTEITNLNNWSNQRFEERRHA
jgi:hypothetical protein